MERERERERERCEGAEKELLGRKSFTYVWRGCGLQQLEIKAPGLVEKAVSLNSSERYNMDKKYVFISLNSNMFKKQN